MRWASSGALGRLTNETPTRVCSAAAAERRGGACELWLRLWGRFRACLARGEERNAGDERIVGADNHLAEMIRPAEIGWAEPGASAAAGSELQSKAGRSGGVQYGARRDLRTSRREPFRLQRGQQGQTPKAPGSLRADTRAAGCCAGWQAGGAQQTSLRRAPPCRGCRLARRRARRAHLGSGGPVYWRQWEPQGPERTRLVLLGSGL